MFRRLTALLGLLLLAAPAATASAAASSSTSSAASSAPIRTVRVSGGVFSPNGDGAQDRLVIRYYLPRPGDDVRLTIRRFGSNDRDLRLVDLGSAEKGKHTWTWNGRDERGHVVRDGSYTVFLSYSGAYDGDSDRVIVDTQFSPQLMMTGGPAESESGTPSIYPRSTAVRDVLGLAIPSDYRDHKVQRLALRIRDPRGRAVLRHVVRDVTKDRWGGENLLAQRWTARLDGKALPAGRYRAVVTGVDRAGNRGRDVQRIWVSKERLVWHEEVRTVLPDGSVVGSCFFDGGSGCADVDYYNPPCGTVTTSQLYVGGLSYRSASCPAGRVGSDIAGRAHWLPLPEAAIRGVASARVRFSGRPTHAGEGDVGTLSISATEPERDASTTSGTVGETADVVPQYGMGLSGDHTGTAEPIPPGVLWGFSTTDGNAVDVKEFTVTARYLAVAD